MKSEENSLTASSVGHLVHPPALRKGQLYQPSLDIPLVKSFLSNLFLKIEISQSTEAGHFQCLIMLLVRVIFRLNPLYYG